MTIFCGFLVLNPYPLSNGGRSGSPLVDVFWTSSARLRRMERSDQVVYFKLLLGYALFGIVMLSLNPGTLITYATMFYNIALGSVAGTHSR
jgi:hypothetical protein